VRDGRATADRDGEGTGDGEVPLDLRGWNCAGGEAKEKTMGAEDDAGGERDWGAEVERGCDREREPARGKKEQSIQRKRKRGGEREGE
jgi:hypothetical protein